ncbi:FecCD family ABC transporter permease [Salimicrobium halophilum]|uniref:Iron complex transport system permease protein n=1 Tax=Salimicrobium halophilum TaxID=86666 RepID=A0A1G8T8G3_9BACI|nr:iron ABC transporter permease [Salimicrobium halophilum]SDJ37899.1 iron complex transport system permease protein [Salimicrobium halophilum]
MTDHFTIRTRSDRFSVQIHKRSLWILIALFSAVVAVFLISLASGSSYIPLSTVLQEVFGESESAFVLNELRMPRVWLAVFVGAALGVSGLILQGMIRNPLGSPDIVGVTGGASVGTVLFLVTLMGEVSIQWLPVASISGAALVTALIYSLSWRDGVTPMRLILVGIGVSALTNAIVTMIMVSSEASVASRVYLWMTGSLYGANWQEVKIIAPVVLTLLFVSFFFTNIVNVKQLGDDVARAVGVRIQFYRLCLLALSVGLAGAAVAFAGGVAFVGLIAPHIARLLLQRSFGILVFGSGMIGALIVLIADIIARTAFLPSDIPVGVFTAGIGAPFFIYLLYRNREGINE